MTRSSFSIIGTAVILLALAASASAQATRTWVSGVGDDANPCSRTAPCKTFAGAISKTAVGGEIDVLDPGGFGAVTITKAISIEAEGVIAGVLVSGTNGIVVSAPAGSNVILRGLTIEGLGTGLNGISFSGGGTLSVENCTINNFTQGGIDVTATNAKVSIKDTTVRNSSGGGIHVHPGSGTTRVSIDRVRMENDLFGVNIADNASATVSNSVATNNSNNGFVVASGGGLAEMNIESSTASNNGSASPNGGLRATGPQGIIRISNVTVTDNFIALSTSGGGQILSYGNNRFAGNGTDASPTGSVPSNPR